MAPRESQFKEFNNIIAKISDNINSGRVGHAEIYEEIKNQLRENLSTIYEEWGSSQFDPSFKFKLSGGLYGTTETTLLHSAIHCREKETACMPLVQRLLEKGADLNVRDSYNSTPLSEAVYTEGDNNKEVVKLLLDAGADPNAIDDGATDSRTLLSIACRYSDESLNVEAAKLLLENGANINEVVDNKENTVLHQLIRQSFDIREQAFKKQLTDLIGLFIKYGANIYASNNFSKTPEGLIDVQFHGHHINDKKFVTSIQKFLEKQKDSIEYHRKLFEVVEQNKDLRSLADIIAGNGLIGIMGIQVCSKVIPQILGIPDIKLVIKGTIAEGEVEQEFSQGTGWPVIEIEDGSLRYYDLFDKIISCFEDNPVVKDLSSQKSQILSYRIFRYIRENTEAIKQELWGESRVSSAPTEVKKKEDSITEEYVAQKPNKDDQDTVKQHGKEKSKGNAAKENRNEISDTSYTDKKPMVTGRSTFNSGVYSQKEPPIFSRKQKIAIAVGIVAALATALVCYSVQLPILAIVVSALIAGVGAYMVSSKLYDVSICNGTNQQPGF
nr:ankyrin repeat domain-containing protein [Rickettsia endosymbiont of Ceutorhynchus assimilis]